MGVFAGVEINESGLVLALDAGNTKSYPGSGTTWTDLSGNGNTGTLTLGPTYNSANGGSIVFDGTNDFIDFTSDSNLLPTAGLTVSVWFKTTVGDRWLVTKTSNTLVNGYALSGNSIVAGNFFFAVSGVSVVTPGSAITGAWFNLVGTWTPSTSLLVYQNSIQVASNTTSIPASIIDPSFPLEIGRDPVAGAPWNGNIAQVSIYNRALSAAEIQQNFNALRGRFGI
jgi:hypothetical protein